MRRILVTLTAVAALAAASLAIAAAGGAAPARGTKTVRLTFANRFSPKTVTIRKGSRVKWVWSGGFHNVRGKGFKSKTTATRGATYRHIYRRTGSFTVVCTIHQALGMKMKVKVVR
jgi:plastocyanin